LFFFCVFRAAQQSRFVAGHIGMIDVRNCRNHRVNRCNQ